MKVYEDKSFPDTSMLQILLKSLISKLIIIIINDDNNNNNNNNNCLYKDFAQTAKSRGGTLVT